MRKLHAHTKFENIFAPQCHSRKPAALISLGIPKLVRFHKKPAPRALRYYAVRCTAWVDGMARLRREQGARVAHCNHAH
jgi:hypothetical protein